MKGIGIRGVGLLSPSQCAYGGGDFSPLSITGLKQWLDSSDPLTLYQDSAMTTPAASDSDLVGGWKDKSGNAANATQATAGSRPTLKTGIQNGKPVVRFGVGGQKSLGMALPSLATYTIFLVYQANLAHAEWNAIISGNATTVVYVGGTYTINYGLQVYGGCTAVDEPEDFVIAAVDSGSIHINGEEPIYVGEGSSGAYTLYKIGGSTTAVHYFDGDIAEIIIYDSVLSDSQRVSVENYLANKWGMRASPISIPIGALTDTNISFDASDVDSSGNIYVGKGSTIKKSINGGITWTDMYTIPGNPYITLCVYCAANGYVYVSGYAGSSDDGLYRSIDGGENWTQVLALNEYCCIWQMDENDAGDLFAGEYSYNDAGDAQIFKSTDDGDNWVQKYSHSSVGQNHIHDVRVDPSNGYVYATEGDAANIILRSTDGGENFTTIYTCVGVNKVLPICFYNGDVLVGTDNPVANRQFLYRFTDGGGATVIPFNAHAFQLSQSSYIYAALNYGGYAAMFSFDWATTAGKNIWLFNGYPFTALESTASSGQGYPSCSRHNYNGKFYVSRGRGTAPNGLILDMSKFP